MDCRFLRAIRPSLSLSIRVICVAALAFASFELFLRTQRYATGFMLLGMASIVVLSISNTIKKLSRTFEWDLERLVVEGSDVPLNRSAEMASQPVSIEQASALLNAAKAERQKQLEYLRALLDTVTAALIVIRPDGRVELMNRAALSMATAPVSRIDQVKAIPASVAQQLLHLPLGSREILTLSDGQRVFASLSGFCGGRGEPLRLVSLQRILGELDAVEITAWRDMAHVLAHEMMNSLTPIASLSESLETLIKRSYLITRGPTHISDEILESLEVINRRSRGLMNFVERYRAVAELPEPRLQNTSIQPLLRGIGRLLEPVLIERNIDYSASVHPTDLCFSSDPELLEQAIINLLHNAIDAASVRQKPQIRVRCYVRNDLAFIEITDNGGGIPASAREQIYVPFFTTKPGGSGIGLSLTRQIALGHRGRLEVRANHPSGSIFTIVIPAENLQNSTLVSQPRHWASHATEAKL